MPYYDLCGKVHKKRNAYPHNTTTKAMSTGSSVATKLVAHAESYDDMEDLTSLLHALSFEEREKRAREEIQEIEAVIRLAELEERLQRLKECRDSIHRGGHLSSSSREETEREASLLPQMAAFAGATHDDTTDKMALPPPSWREANLNDGYSDYGRSRKR